MDALIQAIRQQQQQQNTRRLLVSIAGGPGSGKTTLTQRLVHLLNEQDQSPSVIGVPMDGFYFSVKKLAEMQNSVGPFLRWGAIWTFDAAGMLSIVKQVKDDSDSTVFAPGWDHSIGDPLVNAIRIESWHRVIIFEGLYLHTNQPIWRDIYRLMDLRIFLECPIDVALTRVAHRHLESRIASSLQDAIARTQNNDRLNFETVETQSLIAHITIDSSTQAYTISKRILITPSSS